MTTEESKGAGPASVSTDLLERAAFEAWISAPPFEHSTDRFSSDAAWPGSYREIWVDLAWQAWQASTKAEREACAKVCEDLWMEEVMTTVQAEKAPRYHDCIECAGAIRARSNAAVSRPRAEAEETPPPAGRSA